MAKKVTMYLCSNCGHLYKTASEANKCEREHASLRNLNICDVVFDSGDERFPSTILVDDETHSGNASCYKLYNVSSIEDFYQEGNPYGFKTED